MSRRGQNAIVFWAVYSTLLFFGACTIAASCAGCSEEVLLKSDRIVEDVNQWADAGRQVLTSPAGRTLPPDFRGLVIGGVAVLSGAAAAYKQWRLSQMGKTTKAIIRGIEAADRKKPSNPTNLVKAAIGAEMRKLGIYDVGNKIVDRLKVN